MQMKDAPDTCEHWSNPSAYISMSLPQVSTWPSGCSSNPWRKTSVRSSHENKMASATTISAAMRPDLAAIAASPPSQLMVKTMEPTLQKSSSHHVGSTAFISSGSTIHTTDGDQTSTPSSTCRAGMPYSRQAANISPAPVIGGPPLSIGVANRKILTPMFRVDSSTRHVGPLEYSSGCAKFTAFL